MNGRLQQVRQAYDLTVEQHRRGIDPLRGVPRDLRESPFFKSFFSGESRDNSAAPDISHYLKPGPGMKFLDAGCSANLANYRLDLWPSTYYGIDFSSALIHAMKSFVKRNRLAVGGLFVAELSHLPFKNHFFDIAAVIGVLEYCPLPYIRKSLCELHRVLKPGGRAVLDIPNRTHPYARYMARLEKSLGRPNYLHYRGKFESALSTFFHVCDVDDSRIMLKYYVLVRR